MPVLILQNQDRAAREVFRPFLDCKEPGPARIFVFGLWLALFCLGLNEARGETISREYPLKAVFLLNFAQFTDWPTNAFEETNSPFVIGVLGSDPFGSLLSETFRNEQVNGRKLVVEHYRHIEDVKTCHILFISQSESRQVNKIAADLKGRPVLTVSDIENAEDDGVCVQFITEKNKIRLRINMDSLKAADLTMSSKLLRVAEILPVSTK
jgi:hypothetical protein